MPDNKQDLVALASSLFIACKTAESEELKTLRDWANHARYHTFNTQGIRDLLEGIMSFCDNIDFERKQLDLFK